MSPTPSTRSSTCSRPTRTWVSFRQRVDRRRVAGRHAADQRGHFLGRRAAVEHHALDAGLPEPAHQLAQVLGGVGDWDVGDHQIVPDDADRQRRDVRQHGRQQFGEAGAALGHQGVRRRVELRRAHRRRQAADQLLGEAAARGRMHHRSAHGRPPLALIEVSSPMATLRTPRLPVRAASSSAARASSRSQTAQASGRGVAQPRGAHRRPPGAAVQRRAKRCRGIGMRAQAGQRLDDGFVLRRHGGGRLAAGQHVAQRRNGFGVA